VKNAKNVKKTRDKQNFFIHPSTEVPTTTLPEVVYIRSCSYIPRPNNGCTRNTTLTIFFKNRNF